MNEYNLSKETQSLTSDFLEVARIATISISPDDINVELLPTPHRRPKKLPNGVQAVYWFSVANICLKVGKAGVLSNARFASQHYNPNSSNSNLAKSILNSKERLKTVFPEEIFSSIDSITDLSVGNWIEENTTRCNIYLDAKFDDFVMSFLEIFLQCRLKPIFEGKAR